MLVNQKRTDRQKQSLEAAVGSYADQDDSSAQRCVDCVGIVDASHVAGFIPEIATIHTT